MPTPDGRTLLSEATAETLRPSEREGATDEEFNVFAEALVCQNFILMRTGKEGDKAWELIVWGAENFPWHGATPADLLRTVFRDPTAPDALAAVKSLNSPTPTTGEGQ